MTGWSEARLDELGNFASGKPITPGSPGRYRAYGSNGVIGGAAEARHVSGIIVGRVGAYCGSVAVSHEPFWASDNTIIIEPKAAVDLNYLYYLLLGANLNRHAGGAAQPLVTQGTLKALVFRVPAPKERKRIGALLRSFDELIENNRRRVERLEEMARAIFREWFVDFRYPGHENVDRGDTLHGSIPEGWEVGKLGDLATISSGKRPPTRHSQPGPGASAHVVGASSVMAYTEAPLTKGRTLITGRVGTLGVVQRFSNRVWPSDNTLVLVAENYEYTYQLMLKIDYGSLNRGSAQPLIAQKDLINVQAVVPASELLEAFEREASNLMLASEVLEKQSVNLGRLRDLLLPKLVTGQVDVMALDLDALVEGVVA